MPQEPTICRPILKPIVQRTFGCAPSNTLWIRPKQAPIVWFYENQFHRPLKIQSLERTKTRAKIVDDCRKFIVRFDEDDVLVFYLLTSYRGSLDEFLRLRRSVWPDSRFYHPDFAEQRMHIAVAIVCDHSGTQVAPAMCRSVLGLDNGTAQNCLNFHVRTARGHSFFHGLATQIGREHGRESAEEWHTLTRDVLRHLNMIGDLSQCDPRSYYDGEWGTMTPLLWLIHEDIRARRTPAMRNFHFVRSQAAVNVSGCEKTIFAWLSDLHESGIDLQLYGKIEKGHFRHTASRLDWTTYTYYRGPPARALSSYHQVRLINFQYGRLPTDWVFWWSEPSDEFAGDFWCLVESESREADMKIPGAWID